MTAYARAGIVEVWIVNIPSECLERYTDPTDGGYATMEIVGRGGTIAAHAFPADFVAIDDFLP